MIFYLLEMPEADSSEDFRGRIDIMSEEGCNTGDAPACPRCGRYIGMLTWLPPYRVEIETWGRQYGDVARTGDDLIVSQRFKEAFQRSGLKGLSSFDEVEVVKVVHRRGKPKQPLPRYFKAIVTRSSTAIDQQASGYVWEDESKICPECLFDTLIRHDRLIVREETWNGDDIFYPRGGDGPLASERFKSIYEVNNLCGAIFIPSDSDEAGYEPYPSEAKMMRRVLRKWENTELSRQKRQDAYDTLVFWIYRDHGKRPQGDFDPDRDIDLRIIAEARKRIQEELSSGVASDRDSM